MSVNADLRETVESLNGLPASAFDERDDETPVESTPVQSNDMQCRFAYSRKAGEEGELTHRRCEHCGACEQWVSRKGWVGIKPLAHCKHGHIVRCPSCGVVAT